MSKPWGVGLLGRGGGLLAGGLLGRGHGRGPRIGVVAAFVKRREAATRSRGFRLSPRLAVEEGDHLEQQEAALQEQMLVP